MCKVCMNGMANSTLSECAAVAKYEQPQCEGKLRLHNKGGTQLPFSFACVQMADTPPYWSVDTPTGWRPQCPFRLKHISLDWHVSTNLGLYYKPIWPTKLHDQRGLTYHCKLDLLQRSSYIIMMVVWYRHLRVITVQGRKHSIELRRGEWRQSSSP